MFVLINTTTNQVLAGPMHWNGSYFSYIIRENLDIAQYELPRTKDDTLPVEIDDNHTILPAEILTPSYNSNIEQLAGPFWTIENNVAYGTYNVVDSPIDSVKTNLKVAVADARWKREVSGVVVTIQGQDVTALTTREDRGLYLQALQLNADNSTWKFGNAWLTLSIADLQTIVTAVASHVQDAFNWESSTCQTIDAATTLIELDNIYKSLSPHTPVVE